MNKLIRYKSVDIVKGIAMIMVILVHYNQSFSNGFKFFEYFQMGCPMFFVSSGFVIANAIDNKSIVNKESRIVFYKSRLKSIVPGWYLCLVIIFFINSILNIVFNRALDFGTNRSIVDILCNLLLLNGLVPSANNTVMPGGWYIGATVILYFLSPYIVNIFSKNVKKRKLVFASLSLISVSFLFLFRFINYDVFENNNFGYYSFLNHFFSYCLGILLYFDFRHRTLTKKEILIYAPLSLCVLSFSIATYFIKFSSHRFISSWLAGLFSYFLLYTLLSCENKIKYSFIVNILGDFGRNSYYIYLYHMFVAHTFIQISNFLFCLLNINIDSYIGYIVFMPIVVYLSYVLGLEMKKTTKRFANLISRRF